MTLSPDGGPALPVSVTTTRRVQGGSAIPVYGYTTAPTDGRPSLAGPALPVRVLTAADLKQNGGQWVLEGRPHAMPVYTAPATAQVMGGPALAVYPVNAWPTVTPAPSPLLTNLIAYWKLSDLVDATGNITDLTNNGGCAFGAGLIGNAVTTDTGKYLSHASNAALNVNSGSFTFVFWIKAAAYGTNGNILSKWAGSGYLIWDPSGMGITFSSAGKNLSIAAPSTGAWHLVCAWYDAVAAKMYLQIDNGAVSELASAAIADNAAEFQIGKRTDDPTAFVGQVDEVGFWKRTLTAGERTQLYNGGSGITYPFDSAPALTGGAVSTAITGGTRIDCTTQPSRNEIMVLVPTGYNPATGAPLILYHHGVDEGAYALLGDALKVNCISTLLGAGYILAGSAASGENWGYDAALAAYIELYNWCVANYNITRVCAWSQSMGGVSGLLSLAGTHGAIPYKGWLGTYPICNLADFQGNVNLIAKYGISGDYAAKTAGHDPVLLAATLFDNLRMRFYASAADATVSKTTNSDQMATLVTGHATECVVVVCTGAHGDPSHFQQNDYLDFFNRCV